LRQSKDHCNRVLEKGLNGLLRLYPEEMNKGVDHDAWERPPRQRSPLPQLTSQTTWARAGHALDKLRCRADEQECRFATRLSIQQHFARPDRSLPLVSGACKTQLLVPPDGPFRSFSRSSAWKLTALLIVGLSFPAASQLARAGEPVKIPMSADRWTTFSRCHIVTRKADLIATNMKRVLASRRDWPSPLNRIS
jgi:hypothetical protein